MNGLVPPPLLLQSLQPQLSLPGVSMPLSLPAGALSNAFGGAGLELPGLAGPSSNLSQTDAPALFGGGVGAGPQAGASGAGAPVGLQLGTDAAQAFALCQSLTAAAAAAAAAATGTGGAWARRGPGAPLGQAGAAGELPSSSGGAAWPQGARTGAPRPATPTPQQGAGTDARDSPDAAAAAALAAVSTTAVKSEAQGAADNGATGAAGSSDNGATDAAGSSDNGAGSNAKDAAIATAPGTSSASAAASSAPSAAAGPSAAPAATFVLPAAPPGMRWVMAPQLSIVPRDDPTAPPEVVLSGYSMQLQRDDAAPAGPVGPGLPGLAGFPPLNLAAQPSLAALQAGSLTLPVASSAAAAASSAAAAGLAPLGPLGLLGDDLAHLGNAGAAGGANAGVPAGDTTPRAADAAGVGASGFDPVPGSPLGGAGPFADLLSGLQDDLYNVSWMSAQL